MDTAIRLKLAKKVKLLRKRLGLTQEKLSEASGIDYKYIQRIESKNPPNIKLETIARLAKTLKTTPSKLLDF
jgi:transcriptional regulator with XRE-family HTH domain